MKSSAPIAIEPKQHAGSATQLLYALEGYTGSCRLTVPRWPKTASAAVTELRRMAPLLRSVGVSVTFERAANGTRLIAIAPAN